jgi:hypothetical protein
MERSGRNCLDIGPVHRHIFALLDVTQGNTGVDQRLLERKGTTDDESHQIVTPQGTDVSDLLDQFALAPDPVARDIGADVEIVAQAGQPGIARLGNGEQRAGLGIALAKAQEVVRQARRQNHNIALNEMRCGTAGMPRPAAGTNGQAGLQAGLGDQLRRRGRSLCRHVCLRLFFDLSRVCADVLAAHKRKISL